VDEDAVAGTAMPLPPLAPIERRTFDYSDLERGVDLVIRRTRRSLDALERGAPAGGGSAPDGADRDAAVAGG